MTDVFDPELDGTELIYYGEVTSKRDYSLLWPAPEGPTSESWNLDSLFVS
jgi:hypothetical protein